MTIFAHKIIGVGSGGEQWVTGLHTSLAGTLISANGGWASFVANVMGSAVAALWDPNVIVKEIVTDQLDPGTGRSVGQMRGAVSYPGTSTAVPLSPRDCLLVSLRTAIPGPRGRGRMYWPAPTSTSMGTDGELDAGALTAFGTAIGDAFTSLAAVVTPVVYHRPTVDRITYDRRTGVATDHAASLATAIPIERIYIAAKLATQRRRTNKTVNTYEESSF